MGCGFDSDHGCDCDFLLFDSDSLVWLFDFFGIADWRTRGTAASIHSAGFSEASVAAAIIVRF